MKRYHVSIIDGNTNVLALLEFERPCLTSREYRTILDELVFNATHYSETGFVVAFVNSDCEELFNLSAREYAYGSTRDLDIRIESSDKSMFLKSISIGR